MPNLRANKVGSQPRKRVYMRNSLIIISIVLLGINICYATDYYCNGIIVDTNSSAELYCKPQLVDKYMYQNCLDTYNRAKAEMTKGLCQPTIKRVYKGSCEEITTEYIVSGNVVQKYSTGGNPDCIMKQIKRASDELNEFQRKFINREVDINGNPIK